MPSEMSIRGWVLLAVTIPGQLFFAVVCCSCLNIYQYSEVWLEGGSDIRSNLNLLAQRMLSGTKSSQRPVASSVTQGSVLGPILFNIFITWMDETEFTFGKLTGVSNLEGATATPQDYVAVQKDLSRLEKWTGNSWSSVRKSEKFCTCVGSTPSTRMHWEHRKTALQKKTRESCWTPSRHEPEMCPCCKEC